MRIGIDLDNTIISYDTLFHRVAMEQGVVPSDLPRTKLSVRDHLRAVGQEPVWTAMQSEVYGARLLEAEPFPGVVDFFAWARERDDLTLCICSHKTRHPYIGPPYDLHEAARRWITHHLVSDGAALIDDSHVFFELTKEEKVARIAACDCDYFIDDLPEILTAPGFPRNTAPILFDPLGETGFSAGLIMARWRTIKEFMAAR
jgi:hypothetical protein